MIANRWLLGLGALACFLAPRVAVAGDAAAAEALFNEAKKLAAQGNYASACPQFEESQRQDPGMGTLYNLGDCYEKLGRVASAWAAFLDVAAQAKAAGQAARESDARARAAALDPKLSRLTVVVEGPQASLEGLAVKRSSTVVGKAQWGLALPVDPGEHAVEVTAPGKKPWSGKVQIPPNGGAARFSVPQLEDLPVAAPSQVATPSAAAASEVPEGSERGATQRTAGLIVGALGVAGLGVGGVFGLLSMSKKSEGDDHCKPDNRSCDAQGVAARADALSAGNLSTVFVAVGAPIAVAGAVLFFTAPNAKRANVGFAPVALPGGAGLTVRGVLQ